MLSKIFNYQFIFMILMICSYVHGKCSLNCGDNIGQCLETKIPDIPEICACPNGIYTNSSCSEIGNENETNSSTLINVHARRLIALCEHSYCNDAGVCIVIDSNFACICPDGTIAERCTTSASADVVVSFCTVGCSNDGVCNPLANTCICPSGFSGTRCEIARSTELCRDINCHNGGVCNVVSPTYATCWCLLGFHGDNCERKSVALSCASSRCYNGGTCYEHSPASTIFAYCLCKPGFAGSRCEIEYFRCRNNGFYGDAYGCAYGKYFECVDQRIIVSRSCPRGLRYNFFLGHCDYAANVICPNL